jgi:hypothetical protein
MALLLRLAKAKREKGIWSQFQSLQKPLSSFQFLFRAQALKLLPQVSLCIIKLQKDDTNFITYADPELDHDRE